MTRLVRAAAVTLALCAWISPLRSEDAALARARALLARVPLVDAHNDLPWTLRETFGGDLSRVDLRQRGATVDTDIPRLREGGVSGQFWSVYIPSGLPQPARTQLEQIELARRMIEAYPDTFLLATRAADVERARQQGKIASFLGMENGQALENSLGALRAYYDLGVRYMTLTHGKNTDWADSATDDAKHQGLTPFGREVVREMNRLGMLVDISHVSPEAMRQVLDVSEAPVIFSHSSARALVDHKRNVPDDVLARMAKNGGVVMVTFIPAFVSPETAAWGRDLESSIFNAKSNAEMAQLEKAHVALHGPAPIATLSQVADHIDHVAKIAGHDHVGIGSDYYGSTDEPKGLEDVSRFPDLFAELIRRGWSDANLEKLAGANVLRALAAAETAATRLAAKRAPSTATIEALDRRASAPGAHLFVWAGDAEGKASDFLAVIDADPASAGYGRILASLPTGESGTHPHHTEHEMPANGHLLANGFAAGRTWLFDLTQPLQPRILTSFGDLAGFSHPHTFIRLASGNVMATYQYRSTPGAAAAGHAMSHSKTPEATPENPEAAPGGLVELDETGRLIRSAAAADPKIPDPRIYPYSVLPLPAIDRALSTTTDMNPANVKATSPWVQVWRWSDLTLLRTVALPPGPRGDEHKLTGEPRLLADGKGVLLHTFNCGLYLLRDLDRPEPTLRFVHGFEGTDCGVPVLTGRHWLQPVPAAHALVALDVSNPEQPREVSRVTLGDDEKPHWIAIDPTGRRVVLNSGGYSAGNRLFVLDFDPATGALSLDARFRDAGSERPGVDLTGKTWPHGFTGKAAPHGTVFSR